MCGECKTDSAKQWKICRRLRAYISILSWDLNREREEYQETPLLHKELAL